MANEIQTQQDLLVASEREGWRYARELEDERKRLAGRIEALQRERDDGTGLAPAAYWHSAGNDSIRDVPVTWAEALESMREALSNLIPLAEAANRLPRQR